MDDESTVSINVESLILQIPIFPCVFLIFIRRDHGVMRKGVSLDFDDFISNKNSFPW